LPPAEPFSYNSNGAKKIAGQHRKGEICAASALMELLHNKGRECPAIKVTSGQLKVRANFDIDHVAAQRLYQRVIYCGGDIFRFQHFQLFLRPLLLFRAVFRHIRPNQPGLD
jgi:hypothetical protein